MFYKCQYCDEYFIVKTEADKHVAKHVKAIKKQWKVQREERKRQEEAQKKYAEEYKAHRRKHRKFHDGCSACVRFYYGASGSAGSGGGGYGSYIGSSMGMSTIYRGGGSYYED